MLLQDRKNLNADAKATSAKLLEREVTFIRTDMGTIASISTFLGGFLYKVLNQGADPRENPFEAGSLELLIVAFMINLLCVVSSVLLQVFGPYAALKVKPSELQGVARKIRTKRRMVLRLFLLGLMFFELSTIALIWGRWRYAYAGIATFVIFLADVYIHKIYDGMVEAFNIPSFIPSQMQACCALLCQRSGEDLPDDQPSDVAMFTFDYQNLEDGTGYGPKQSDSQCLKCNSMVAGNATFCNVCGAIAPHRCVQCHALLSGDGKFCASCGCDQQKARGQQGSDSSVGAMAWSPAPETEVQAGSSRGTGGWLRRQTKYGAQWRNFYFQLSGSTLQKFDKPQGSLLREYEIPRNDAVLDLPGRSFKVAKIVKGTPVSQGKLQYLYLQALSDDSKQTWMQALTLVGNVRKSNLDDVLVDVEEEDEE